NIKSPHLLKLVEAGVVNWTPEGRQLFAFVFDMPPAKRLMAPGSHKALRIPEERIVAALIEPAVGVLAELRDADIVHGALSPDNIFMAGANGAEAAVLGECLTSAPGFRIHPSFETIERGMAQPSGRGPGSVKNDLYTLGICIAIALRGFNPLAGKSVDQIIEDKIEHGTYACLVGSERLSAGITELLRGLMHDDESGRWTLDDVLRWMEGRRLSAKQPYVMPTAARPFAFRE